MNRTTSTFYTHFMNVQRATLTRLPKVGWLNSTSVRQEIWRNLVLLIGIVLAGAGYSVFQVPYKLAPGGAGGLAVIIQHFINWPAGILFLLVNIPLLVVGYFYLGRWNFVIRTAVTVVLFSIVADVTAYYLPAMIGREVITDDILLSSVYAGIITGVGAGLIFHAGSTVGGTSILGRIIQIKTGMPLSQVFLYTDGAIVLVAGFLFGWEIALYSMLTLFVWGLAADYALEGPSSARMATIVTQQPKAVGQALMDGLGRGVSQWEVKGGYTGNTHYMLTCTIYRPQVNDLKNILAEVDPQAFVTIGVAHQAFGGVGFSKLKKQ